ncbi:MAG TPA: hypothetical protein VHX88_14240 [Solirubrobacteraceae bacterium]|nr:hypothetical protein [Solirubrobacteraceae bacterium]
MPNTPTPEGRIERARSLYGRHFSDPRRERAMLSTTSFTMTFGIVRAITHAIRDGRGPFRNISAGGRHVHHLTFGIAGLLGCGFVWTQQWGVGMNPRRRGASRASAIAYGASSALTLDEFALWLDLQDDYWTAAGRKSIDAVTLFGGVLGMTINARGLLRELALARRVGTHRAAEICKEQIARRHTR